MPSTAPATVPESPRPSIRSDRRVAGALLVAVALLAALGAIWLSASFGWPEILDEPGVVALPRFAENEASVRTAFLALMVSSLLLIPAAIYLERVGRVGSAASRAVAAAGILGAFAQVLGWVRWPVTVPHLADAFTRAATDADRTSIAAAYDVLNRYAGGALGEHLGWVLQGAWGVGLAVLLMGVDGIPRWFAHLGLYLTAAWWPLLAASGPLPEVDWLAPVGSTISVAWYLWLLALGGLLVGRPPTDHSRSSVGDAAAE